jgi:hypothetical protein
VVRWGRGRPGRSSERVGIIRLAALMSGVAIVAAAAMLFPATSGLHAEAAHAAHSAILRQMPAELDVLKTTGSSPGPTPGLPTPAASSASFVRGAYGTDSSRTGSDLIAANGFNTVMANPYKEFLDPLPARGLKAIVWLGAWKNSPTCNFERDDAKIAAQVAPIAGHPAILAYYLGDEPRVSECPGAPALLKRRSDLVHSLDPGSTTFTVIQAYENGITHDYAPWSGIVDIVGFDVYPCHKTPRTCDFGSIDSAAAAIKSAGITRYWAIVGDFQDCYYRLPTTQELGTEFDHWARSEMSGYLVFSWNYVPADSSCVGTSLESHPENVAQLKTENSRTFTPPLSSSSQPSGRTPTLGGIGEALSTGGFAVVVIAAAVLGCIGVALVVGRRWR